MKNNNKNSKQSKDEVTTLDPATPLGDSELSLLAETKKNKASKRKSSESVEDLSVKTDTVEPPRSSLKIKKQEGFKTPFKPLPQLIYLGFSIALMGYLLVDRPKESLAGIGILVLGWALYAFDKKNTQ